MKTVRWFAVLLLIASIPAEARSFGERFPLTNTRYRAATGDPLLVTNNKDFFLFWPSDGKLRASRVDEGEPRVSHVVLDQHAGFDIAWLGDRYLVVTSRARSPHARYAYVLGRFLDAEAHPIGPEFLIADMGEYPRIAVGGDSLMLLYRSTTNDALRALPLSYAGRPIGESKPIGPSAANWALTNHGDGFLAVAPESTSVRAVKLDRNGQTVSESRVAVPGGIYREVAAAGNGTRSLVMWSGASVTAATVDESGAFGAPLVIEESGTARHQSAIWNGAGWTLAYTEHANSTTARAHIVHVHFNGQAIIGRQTSTTGIAKPTVAALGGRELAAWRPNGLNTSPAVIALPLAANRPRVAPYVPQPQTLLGTQASAGSTLTVWSETIEGGVAIHTGVRDLDGNWSERELTSGSAAAIRLATASNGQTFGVALAIGNGPARFFRLDRAGRPLGAPITLPFSPVVMAATAAEYAVFDSFRGVLIGDSGEVSAPVLIAPDFVPSAAASDGDGFLLAGEIIDCPFILCSAIDIGAVRLDQDLNRLDAKDLLFASGDYSPRLVGVSWYSSNYVMVWSENGTLMSLIPPDLNSGITSRRLDADFPVIPEAMAVMHDGTIAIAGRAGFDSRSRVAFVTGDGTLLQSFGIEPAANVLQPPRLERIPGGGVAYIASSVQDAAPHEGTSRIVMAIARPSTVLPPDAPHVSVSVRSGTIYVDWSAPPGTINGYRLEYRIDDDAWVEYEQWFRPGAQSKAIKQPAFGQQFAFRVRAFNDGGAGAYSATVVTKPSRRRAVR